MYPFSTQFSNRSNDFAIDIKGDEGGPSRATMKEKGKIKILSTVCLEKSVKFEERVVMPVGKRNIDEKEARSLGVPSKKKGKVHKDEDAKAKQKRRARRKFQVSDFPLGDGQLSYNLKEELSSRKADVTFGKLVEMVPKLKR